MFALQFKLQRLPGIPFSASFFLIHSYEVVGKNDGLVTLKCKLYTGKTHQIRIHLKDALGIDIVNDKKYGKKPNAGKAPSFLDKKQMYLHCKSIQLCLDGKQLCVRGYLLFLRSSSMLLFLVILENCLFLFAIAHYSQLF